MGIWDFVSKVGTAVIEKALRDAERAQEKQQEMQRAPTEPPQTSASYHHGRSDNRTAFVLSAPGRSEKAAQAPLAGASGKTIHNVLERLNKCDPETFPSSDKTDYRTISATDRVHYQSATGSTEGKKSEIVSQKNLDRVRKGSDGIDTVVAYGKRAQDVVKASGFQGKVIESSHPSMQNLNRNISATGDTAAARADDRISKFSKVILKKSKS